MATDWKDIPGDSKEKYALYLCSREWAELRRAVHERAGGDCERCGVHEIDAVHHLTYERKYAERLEDLQANCNGCHQFVHGLSDFDPAEKYYVELLKLSPKVLVSIEFGPGVTEMMMATGCVFGMHIGAANCNPADGGGVDITFPLTIDDVKRLSSALQKVIAAMDRKF